MRLIITLVPSAMLFMLASAQTNDTLEATSVVLPSGTVELTPAQSSQAACLTACPATDANCREKCIVVPIGDYSNQNATIECVSDCVKGNGTAAQNLAYANCQKACVALATVIPASTAAPTETGSSTATSKPNGNTKTTEATGTDAGTVATASSSGSPSSTSKAAAEILHVGASIAGVVGAFAAVFAF